MDHMMTVIQHQNQTIFTLIMKQTMLLWLSALVITDVVRGNQFGMKVQYSDSHDTVPSADADGCHCYNTCDEQNTYLCATKCSCEFWYDTPQRALELSRDMMQKNAHFRNTFGALNTHYRTGNDYYGRQGMHTSLDAQMQNNPRYDRRSKSSGDPFQSIVFGKTNSWSRYEEDACYYQMCRGHNTKCAWFYDFYNCGADRNNNGRYYDEYFTRARLDHSSRGAKCGQNTYGLARLEYVSAEHFQSSIPPAP
eukprot:580989_1